MTTDPTSSPEHGLRIEYPADLPVAERRDEIVAALREHPVVILAGETGSGKTTQLPKMLLEAGKRSIAHTQPRRIAARAVAERIAEETATELGAGVGYRVRFTDKASAASRITVMTDGILLNEIHRDRTLSAYDAIIIDEAHERSLNIDFLLGLLARVLRERDDLTVVVTSATIDPESFARHFAADDGTPAPIISVSGRSYPVEIRYRPLIDDDGDADPSGDSDEDPDRRERRGATDTVSAVLAAIRELDAEAPGDILVFLSGEAAIRDTVDAIVGARIPGIEALPLFGRLTADEQHRIFDTRRAPGIRRRVVVATNVAETSLTVPGIRYVIDEGTARVSRYSARSKVQRLPIEPISQANANQRSGRSGRVAPGIAIRLYAEADHDRRPEYPDPEILRTNLASVILQMAALDLGDVAEFGFLTPPDRRGVTDGIDLLRELGALDGHGRITRIGRRIARLPLDPRLGRMLVAAESDGQLPAVIPIVAALAIQDPRERPTERRAQADTAHARFTDPTSDFLSLLNLWRHLERRRAELSGNQFRRELKAQYLNVLRVREWADVMRQLERAMSTAGRRGGALRLATDAPVDATAIHRAILTGLLSHIGVIDRVKREYAGARNSRFVVFPGSALMASRGARKGSGTPEAVMAYELVETSRLFARTVAAIDPGWAEAPAGDLVRRTVSDPHWARRRGAVLAHERVTLFGVPIVARRAIDYARIDEFGARELFIRHALVDGDWETSRLPHRLTRFLDHNADVRETLAAHEERTRSRSVLLDDESIVEFYRLRIPLGISSTTSFLAWWRAEFDRDPDALSMRAEDFLGDEEDATRDPNAFPETWSVAGATHALRYQYAPGASGDGVTMVVPLGELPAVAEEPTDWLVPGMREELITAWIKTLPKVLRREVVPAADWARRLAPDLPTEPEGPFLAALSRVIRAATYAPVTESDFDVERLPSHLAMSLEVVDEAGAVIATGTDARALTARFAERINTSRGITPRTSPRADLAASPTKVAGPTAPEVAAAHRRSLVQRLIDTTASPGDYVLQHLTTSEKLALATAGYRSTPALLADCFAAVAAEVVDVTPGGSEAISDEPAFDALRERFVAASLDGLRETVVLTAAILDTVRQVRRDIDDTTHLSLIAPLADASRQLDALIFDGFVGRTGLPQLRRLPTYLAGIRARLRRLRENPGRDSAWRADVERATNAYLDCGGALPAAIDAAPTLTAVRWQLEELRLSLFAQELGARGPVSVKRIQTALAAL